MHPTVAAVQALLEDRDKVLLAWRDVVALNEALKKRTVADVEAVADQAAQRLVDFGLIDSMLKEKVSREIRFTFYKVKGI